MNDPKVINYMLLKIRMEESHLNRGEWAKLLGVDRTTFTKYLKNYHLMPLGKFIQLCQYVGIPIEEALWFQKTSVKVGYKNARMTNSITGREMEMISRDNVSTELDLKDHFNLTLDYLRQIRPNRVEGEKYCVIPPK